MHKTYNNLVSQTINQLPIKTKKGKRIAEQAYRFNGKQTRKGWIRQERLINRKKKEEKKLLGIPFSVLRTPGL